MPPSRPGVRREGRGNFSPVLQDLCTVSELKAMEQRINVAMLLDEGLIYSEILERTGASSATISRVNRCLHYGADGYRTVIPRLREQERHE